MDATVIILEQRHEFMVLVSGFAFPEGRSFRMERTVEDAVALRRDIQQGRVALRRIKQPFVLFEEADEFPYPSEVT
jgi:hypothetical protein